MSNRHVLGRCVLAVSVVLSSAALAFAQQPSTPQQSSSSTGTGQTGSALSTQNGDTGLWVVPTADVLPAKKWAVSFYRTNQDDGQGFSDVSNFPANFAIGIKDRVELFGSWTVITRIDRDTRQLFFTSTTQAASTGTGGGLLVNFPLDRSSWIGNARGDLRLGGKFNLMSQADGAGLSAAVRVIVKLPIGDDTLGSSSGKTDVSVHGIVSKETPIALFSAYAGPIVRGNPAGFTLTNGLEWGIGAGFPERWNFGFHFTAELYGEKYFTRTITAPAGLFGVDGSAVPTSTDLKSPVFGDIGLTWQAPTGFFIGAAASWNLHIASRDEAQATTVTPVFTATPKDDKGFEVRIGFHPGARGNEHRGHATATTMPTGPSPTAPTTPPVAPVTAPVAPPAPATPPAAAVNNRPPTVRALCDPCTVEVGKTSTVSADAQDPDGDPLTYRWTAPMGTFANGTSRQTPWTAPMQEGPVRATVTVDDGHGHQASDAVTIQVVKPAAKEIVFEDVHFDFDRSALRPEAQKILDDAVTAMQSNPALQITIEGHTCNIGTAEYNLALGERRAKAVRDYFVGKGISADRLRTVSYGAERPKYDNSREDTRRLNRRAALIVRFTTGGE